MDEIPRVTQIESSTVLDTDRQISAKDDGSQISVGEVAKTRQWLEHDIFRPRSRFVCLDSTCGLDYFSRNDLDMQKIFMEILWCYEKRYALNFDVIVTDIIEQNDNMENETVNTRRKTYLSVFR